MTLSIRLEAILSMLEKTDCLADIGCDHGFLPIEALRRGLCARAIACDLREGPLERAREHVQEAGLEERIDLRISNGLSALGQGEASTVVIAGMGGDLIAEILAKACSESDVLASVDQLILQPQSEMAKVRRALSMIGFHSVKERIVTDREKVYWIWRCVPGEEAFEADWQWEYGLYFAKTKDPSWREYLAKQQRVKEALLEKLSDNSSEAARKRGSELEREIAAITEALTYGNDGSEDR